MRPAVNTMTTLIVGLPLAECAFVRKALADGISAISCVAGLHDASAQIDRPDIDVVITERDLPDGCWTDVLDVVSARPKPPVLIVTSRLSDERLWAEVLNRGGYDVLAQPLCADEVKRVGELARDYWSRLHGGTGRADALDSSSAAA